MPERMFLAINIQGDGEAIATVLGNLTCKLQDGWVLDPIFQSKPIKLENAVIYHLIKYTKEEQAELEKSEPEEQVTSLKDVPHSEVDQWLNLGYKVHTIYAKSTILTKVEAKAVE